jgi:hypothetical protein
MDYINKKLGNKKVKKYSYLSSTIKQIRKENQKERNKSANNPKILNKKIGMLQKRNINNNYNQLYQIKKPKTIEYNDCK